MSAKGHSCRSGSNSIDLLSSKKWRQAGNTALSVSHSLCGGGGSSHVNPSWKCPHRPVHQNSHSVQNQTANSITLNTSLFWKNNQVILAEFRIYLAHWNFSHHHHPYLSHSCQSPIFLHPFPISCFVLWCTALSLIRTACEPMGSQLKTLTPLPPNPSVSNSSAGKGWTADCSNPWLAVEKSHLIQAARSIGSWLQCYAIHTQIIFYYHCPYLPAFTFFLPFLWHFLSLK